MVSHPWGRELSGLTRWHFVSGGWKWNLPNHSLVFAVRVILVHMKPQPGFCPEPGTFLAPSFPWAPLGSCMLRWTVACPGVRVACSGFAWTGLLCCPEPQLRIECWLLGSHAGLVSRASRAWLLTEEGTLAFREVEQPAQGHHAIECQGHDPLGSHWTPCGSKLVLPSLGKSTLTLELFWFGLADLWLGAGVAQDKSQLFNGLLSLTLGGGTCRSCVTLLPHH